MDMERGMWIDTTCSWHEIQTQTQLSSIQQSEIFRLSLRQTSRKPLLFIVRYDSPLAVRIVHRVEWTG